jgi:hypothetical protein
MIKIHKEIKKAILDRYSHYDKKDIELVYYKNIVSPDITVYIVKRRWYDEGDDIYRYEGDIDYNYDESSVGISGNTLKECKEKIKTLLKDHINYEHNQIKKFIREI